MAIHFLNVYIPKDKNLKIGLTYIYGIGQKESVSICKKLGLNSTALFGSLNDKILTNLSNYIEFNYIHGFHLKRLKRQRLESLIKLKTYRGTRLKLGLLVRGQKSRNKKLRRHF